MNENLKRRENESLFEWKLRLSLMKLNKETDLDWSELVELLEMDMSADHYRKISYGYKEYDDYIKSKTKEMIAQEEYQKLIEKELQLEAKKVKIRDMQNHLNKTIRDNARHDNIGDILKDKMDEIGMCPKVINDEYKRRISSGKQAIAMWSDWHYGIEVDNFLNKFNPETCKKRVDLLVDRTIDYCKLNNIDVLNIFVMGDIISAENYNVIRLQNRVNLIDQIIEASDLLNQAILKLSKYIPYLTIGVCTGNHCRSHEKSNATNRDNYIHLIKKYMQVGLQYVSNITFLENSFDDEIINANINGLNVIAMHGDKIAKSNGSYKLSAILDQKIDLLCLGHWHESRMETNHRTIVHINGSIVSSDEYARNLNLYAFPTQKLIIIGDEEIECVYDIRLDKTE